MIAILKYNAGNIRSVQIALNRLKVDSIITNDHEEILNADKVIIPGVGEASTAMAYLKENGLDKLILSLSQPVLGICLGLQLMCLYSEEADTACLGIFNTRVKKFPSTDLIPQMGWNNFDFIRGALFQDISPRQDVYFVHSYYAEPSSDAVAISTYSEVFSSALHKDNYYATQFHPEKSADVGAKILSNFISL